MPILEVQHLYKNFGSTKVLRHQFYIGRGKALAIIGSSGSGKTTLLRCLNFLETPNEGKIIVNGETHSTLPTMPPRAMRRFARTVCTSAWCSSVQSVPAVHRTRERHARSPAAGQGTPGLQAEKTQIHEQIEHHAIELLEMMASGRMSHYPHQLSGGQQPRCWLSLRVRSRSSRISCASTSRPRRSTLS